MLPFPCPPGSKSGAQPATAPRMDRRLNWVGMLNLPELLILARRKTGVRRGVAILRKSSWVAQDG